jgi:hypothetical protein
VAERGAGAAAGDALRVAIEAGHCLDHAVNLFFAFGPQPRYRLTLAVEVSLHLGEPLYDGRWPVSAGDRRIGGAVARWAADE